MEIFYEEATSLINELKSAIQKYKDCKTYDKEFINNVFRIIHTMKADSTMMLLDTIAVPSRMFESLLVFFRNNKLDIEDRESFDNIIQNMLAMFQMILNVLQRENSWNRCIKTLKRILRSILDS